MWLNQSFPQSDWKACSHSHSSLCGIFLSQTYRRGVCDGGKSEDECMYIVIDIVGLTGGKATHCLQYETRANSTQWSFHGGRLRLHHFTYIYFPKKGTRSCIRQHFETLDLLPGQFKSIQCTVEVTTVDYHIIQVV